MPEYNALWFAPPAPLARVTLRNPDTGAVITDIPMLLDTGADVTLVPRTTVMQLNVTPVANQGYELIGFDGSTSLVPVVRLELLFLRRTFRGQLLLIEQEWGILGRNILNRIPLRLDGPRLTWTEE